jgi:nucleoid DNA-binding protein
MNGFGHEVSRDKPKTKATPTKQRVYAELARKTGLSEKQVKSVFKGLTGLISQELGKKGPGAFVVPGLLKLKVVRKPPTKAKQGINPFTNAPTLYKAKPARNVVKAVPLRTLKEIV